MPKVHVKQAVYNFLQGYNGNTVAITEILDNLIEYPQNSIIGAIKALKKDGVIQFVRGVKPRRVILSEKANGYLRVKNFFLDNPKGFFTQVSLMDFLGLEQTHVSRYTRRVVREGIVQKKHVNGKTVYTVSGGTEGTILCPRCNGTFLYKHGKGKFHCQECRHVWDYLF